MATRKRIDMLSLNNQIVSMRNDVKRGQLWLINYLNKRAKQASTKKGDERQKAKNSRKAERFLGEIQILKRIDIDEVSKFALCSKVEANQVPAQLEKLEVDQRAMFRLAYHKFVQAKVTEFRSDYAIPVDRLILLIRGLGIRYQKKKAKKAESDEKVDLPTKQIKPVKTPTSKPAPVVHSDDVLDDYDVSDEEQFDNSRPIEVVNSSDESDEEGLSDEETLRPVQVVNSSDESDVEEEDVDDEEGEDENVEDEGGEDEDGEDNDGEDEESEDEDEEDGVDEENEDVEVSEPPQKTEAGDKSVLVISKGKNDSEKKPMEGKMPSSSTTEPNGLAKSKLKERTRLKVQWPTSNEVAIDKKDGDCRVKKLNLKLLETAEIVFESDDTKVNKVPAFQPEVPRDSFFLGGIDPSSESEGEGDRRDRAQDWAQDRGRAKNAPTWKQRQSGYRSNEWDEKPHHQKPRQERPRQERPRQEKPRPDTRVDKLTNKFANRTPLGPERSFGGPPAKATKGVVATKAPVLDEASLHPSWQAKRKQQVTISLDTPQGKKIKFDDD